MFGGAYFGRRFFGGRFFGDGGDGEPAAGDCACWDCVMSDGRTAAQVLMDTNAKVSLIEKILRNKQITDPIAGTMTVYDDDGTTVLLQGNLFENAAGTQTYRGQGAERRERLT